MTMQLNLPILEQLADSRRILIAGAGGGFDIFAGLPLYFTLRALGKQVHLANYSFTPFDLAAVVGATETLLDGVMVGARSPVHIPVNYYPEGYLAQWFQKVHGDDVTVWMLVGEGVVPLIKGYQALVEHLKIDAVLLVDGGVDSLMRGDEVGAGTLVEDSISLAAVDALDVPVKMLACIGFGTEQEEKVCHYHALANIAALAKAGGFLGSCALTPQMDVFQQYEAACRYVWEQPGHDKSHISTRIIPSVHGEFGQYRMYPDHPYVPFISPLMSLYWFFDARVVIQHSLLIPRIRQTVHKRDAITLCAQLMSEGNLRPCQPIPH